MMYYYNLKIKSRYRQIKYIYDLCMKKHIYKRNVNILQNVNDTSGGKLLIGWRFHLDNKRTIATIVVKKDLLNV